MQAAKGSYALVLALERPVTLRIGRLGEVRFDAPYYVYAGSALGPGGLAARLRHHERAARRPHWHIDYLRAAAEIVEIWSAAGPRRRECAWAAAVLGMRGAVAVHGFGASDCCCASHLAACGTRPSLARFRRCLRAREGTAEGIRSRPPS